MLHKIKNKNSRYNDDLGRDILYVSSIDGDGIVYAKYVKRQKQNNTYTSRPLTSSQTTMGVN